MKIQDVVSALNLALNTYGLYYNQKVAKRVPPDA